MLAREVWYAAYTKFQHEKTAVGLLDKKGFETFLPLYRTVHRWKDRNQLLILPLFPCYLFLRTSLERKLDVLSTAGIRWIVESAGNACAIPEAEIDALKKICATGRVLPHPFLKQGDVVRVRSGSLAGMEGILARIKNQCRVVLSMELLQKSVSVEIDAANLEAVPVNRGFTPLAAVKRSA